MPPPRALLVALAACSAAARAARPAPRFATRAAAVAAAHARARAAPPACTNLSGTWSNAGGGPVALAQPPPFAAFTTAAAWGAGAGNVSALAVRAAFSNEPAGAAPLAGALAPDCASISWSNGALWWRGPAPPPPPPPPIASPSPPAWASRLAIAELNTRTFTAPAGAGAGGSGSGTWAAAAARLPHLAGAGVTGVWVAYFNMATAHFYGIDSVYAALDPPALDARLGSDADFGAFVAAAHAAGVRVFLDVIGHGLVNESAYVGAHPGWFAGGSWGMVDFDYANEDFRAWFAGVWVGYVERFGVDGFRIDCGLPDAWLPVWNEVAARAAAAGHPVAIFGESGRYHFEQHDLVAPVDDVAAAAKAFTARGVGCAATIQFSCHDHGWESGPGNCARRRGVRVRMRARHYALTGHYALTPCSLPPPLDAPPPPRLLPPRLARALWVHGRAQPFHPPVAFGGGV